MFYVSTVNNVVSEYIIMKKRLLSLSLISALLAIAVLSQLSVAEDKAETAPKDVAQVVRVKRVELSPGYKESRTHTGRVEATRTAELSFLKAGRIQNILVDEGSSVTKGQLLATLDVRSLQAERQRLLARRSSASARYQELLRGPRKEPKLGAQAQVRRLRSELELARTKLARREELYAKGAISLESLDEWESQVRVAEERLEAAGQSFQELDNGTRPEVLQQARADVSAIDASLQALRVQFEDSDLRAPFSGRIALRSKDEGVIVGAGEPLLSLDEDGAREAIFDLPIELTAPKIAQLELAGQTLQGRLLAKPSRVDQRSATHRVRYSLDDGLPGSVVSLKLEDTVTEPGYWLPVNALSSAGNGLWQCYSVDSDSKVLTQRVEVLHRDGDKVLVRGTLAPGAPVIVEGVASVVTGQKVLVAQ